MVALLGSCGEDQPPPQPIENNTAACEACLASGGTWQPEAEACTEACEIQDISCYSQACPEACSPTNCGDCFSLSDCETMSCEWVQQNEIMWCR